MTVCNHVCEHLAALVSHSPPIRTRVQEAYLRRLLQRGQYSAAAAAMRAALLLAGVPPS